MLRLRRPLLALIALALLLGGGYTVSALRSSASGGAGSASASATNPPHSASTTAGADTLVAASSLPPEVVKTIALIRAGGPFPYSQDGVVFANREHRLPEHPRGYYHEYTVPTPGAPDRGARRLVTGEATEYYYTADHYATFVGVDPDR